MKKRISSTLMVFLLTLIIAGVCCEAAFAGKLWSNQVLSVEDDVVIVGIDNKFASVFGIGLKDMRRLWKADVSKSLEVSINLDGDVVYLVAPEDVGFEPNIVAHRTAQKEKLWSRKIRKFQRKSPVFIDDENLYFAAEVPYRNVILTRIYAIRKEDGKNAWEDDSYSTTGSFRYMIRDNSGDFILFSIPGTGDASAPTLVSNIQMTRINRRTGREVWNKTIKGNLAYEPKVLGDTVSYVAREYAQTRSYDRIEIVSSGDGELQWIHRLPEGKMPFTDPVVSGNSMILLTISGDIYFITAGDDGEPGSIQWEYNTGDTPLMAPVVRDDRILTLAGRVDGQQAFTRITSLDLTDGHVLWDMEMKGSPEFPVVFFENLLITVTPEIRDVEKDGSEHKEYSLNYLAIDEITGQQIWESKIPGRTEGETKIKNGVLYSFVFDREIRDKFDQPIHQLLALDPATGEKKWVFHNTGSINPQLQVLDGHLLFGTKDGLVVSINPATGQEIFKKFVGAENELDTNIVMANGLLGFGTENGNYFIVNSQGEPKKKMMMKPLFAMHKLPIFIGCLILSSAISWYIYHARKGKEMFIRKIAGLSAIDEAVGRSTEMGKPVLYITGLADVEDIQTLASLSILGHIAAKTAEYDTPLIVPCCRSVVMSTAQEVCKEAYLKAGRPETFRRENIHYLTDDQFGYVAGVDGIMIREKPAANFYMGKFFAESLILAETGHSTGAIQIAGTAEASQLPFFVAACDYTLIGEELLAASAYLSKDPLQIGSLKGQDIAKAVILIVIILGSILYSIDAEWSDWVKLLFTSG